MQKLQRVSFLETKREWSFFLVALFFIASVSLLLKYNDYQRFLHTSTVQAVILNHYTKTTSQKRYRVIKLQTPQGYTFYTTTSTKFRPIRDTIATLKVYPKELSFFKFLKGFYTPAYFIKLKRQKDLRHTLAHYINIQHTNTNIKAIYKALFLAFPLPHSLQKRFSSLGIGHLFAISGFHLGLLSGVLFFLLGLFYTPLHKKLFPYRDKKRDLFYLSGFILFWFMLLLDAPPSLVRAYWMMMLGFFFYDRGISLLKLENFFVTIAIIIAFEPQLLFQLGFWLSVLGVFYILLFFIHFHSLAVWQQLLALPAWIYLMMLPTALYLFGNFSFYHPLSILLSMAFSLFYPLALVLHLLRVSFVLDPLLTKLLALYIPPHHIKLEFFLYIPFLALSFGAIWSKKILYILFFYALGVLGYAFFTLLAK